MPDLKNPWGKPKGFINWIFKYKFLSPVLFV